MHHYPIVPQTSLQVNSFGCGWNKAQVKVHGLIVLWLHVCNLLQHLPLAVVFQWYNDGLWKRNTSFVKRLTSQLVNYLKNEHSDQPSGG